MDRRRREVEELEGRHRGEEEELEVEVEVELLVMEEEAVELSTIEEMVKVQHAKEVVEEVVLVLQIKKMGWK